MHGLFESLDAACKAPGCEAIVSTVFLKPIGVVSQRTRQIDRDLRATAASFGMTNLRSTREHDTQLGMLPDPVPLDVPDYVHASEAPRDMPPNIIWGPSGNIQAASMLGGQGSLDLGKEPPARSPMAEMMHRAGTTLPQKTVVVRKPHGLTE